MSDETTKNPNPQGKGLVPVMQDLHAVLPHNVASKPAVQILADYFTSMLVLSARFRFRPVVGQEYFLYRVDGDWSLSLIRPEEWTDARRAAYVGRCELHTDMTWTIDPAPDLSERPDVLQALASFHDDFVASLDSDDALEDALPYYVSTAPYYQRLLASALSRSLRGSMDLGGQLALAGRNWLAHATAPGAALLGHSIEAGSD